MHKNDKKAIISPKFQIHICQKTINHKNTENNKYHNKPSYTSTGKERRNKNKIPMSSSALKSGTRPPWVGLGAAVWVQIAAGNAYNFPLYSHALKSVLGYNQQQLTLLGVANDIGENFGIVPGVFCNKLPAWMILCIGAASCFLGYGVIWFSVSGTLHLPFWVLWIALCIATNSAAWLSTGVLVTNMRNFPLSRGTVAGILKGYSGISAAVYTQIYSGLLNSSSTRLLQFLTLGLPLLCLAMMFFVRPCTPASEEDQSAHAHFLFTQISSVILGVYIVTTTILDDVLSFNQKISYTLFCVMILLLLAPLAIPLKMTIYPQRRKEVAVIDQDKTESLLEVSSSTSLETIQESESEYDVDILLAEGEGAVVPAKKKRRPKRGEDFNFKQALVKADFWLLFMVYFLGVGSSITVLNNLAQIGMAAGDDDTTLLLSILSFCNFVGRLGGGAVSEYFVRSRTIPRTLWMTVAQLTMIFVYLLYASALSGTLYACTALLGICYGILFSVMVPTSSELFGLKHFGKIYNFMVLGNPLGALLFSAVLAGYVYDTEAAKQQSSVCLGPSCFRLTFLVLSAVSVLGTVLGVVLTLRVKPVYQKLYSSGSFRLPNSSVQ